MFLAFLNFEPKWLFCKVYSLCLEANFGYFQNALIFRILGVFRSRFLHTTTLRYCRIVFHMFLAFLIFDPKWLFCKVYSLCLEANFGYFQNALIFRILGVFWSRFLHTTTLRYCRIVFHMFLAFLIFDPKWLFCKVYSLCLEANFSYFQNALIFRILGVFWSRFLHTTALMWL